MAITVHLGLCARCVFSQFRNAFIGIRREAKNGIFGIFVRFLHIIKVFKYEEFNGAVEYLPKNYLLAILAHTTHRAA